MLLSSRRRAGQVIHGSRTAPGSRSRCSPARPHLEEMETRLLPSVSAALIKDLNVQPASSNPSNFLTIGAITYFSANNGRDGNELWRTDRTAAGTYMLKDLNPNSSGNPNDFVNFKGELLFLANTESAEQLWKSDGSVAGTQLIKAFSGNAGLADLTVVGNTVIFIAADAGHSAVWRINPTLTSAWVLMHVEALPPGAFSVAFSVGSPFTIVNGAAFFAGYDATHGAQLWKSDGTMAGTGIVKDLSPSGGIPIDWQTTQSPFHMAAAGNLLFFVANDGVHGNEVWRSDGSATGTFMVRDIDPGGGNAFEFPDQGQSPYAYLNVFTVAGNDVFFNAYDGTDGNALWVSDGTSSGTHIVIGAAPGSGPQLAYGITASGGGIYYSTSSSGWLWHSDGTSAGTYLVKQINPAPPGGLSITGLATVNGLFIFLADDGTHGTEMWASDGTANGTVLLKDIAPGSASAFDTYFSVPFAVSGSELYFMPNVLNPVDGSGLGFWKTDGTPAGTIQLADTSVPEVPNFTFQVAATNGAVVFDGNDGAHATQLWTSDGTASGTTLVKDINTGTLGSISVQFETFAAMNGSIYFSTGVSWPLSPQLWKTNGGPAGTVLVASIPAPLYNGLLYGIQDLTAVGNTLFFVADDGRNGVIDNLWKSDGTAAGTVIVVDPSSSSSPHGLSNLIRFNNELYFVAAGALWKSDGSAAGTVMVADPGAINSFVIAHNRLFFLNGNDQLWVSDGTTAGTILLQNLGANPQNEPNPSLFALNGALYYSSNADGQGWQLWKTDGTAGGTHLLKVLTPGSDANPTNFVNVNALLYFTANDGTGGAALWKSDGTTTGTQLVMDFPANGAANLVNLNGRLFFTAGAGGSTDALWQSDGTAAGTTFVVDIGRPVDTTNFTVVNGILFFVADDGFHGPSLWESDGTQAGTIRVPGIRREGASNPAALTVLWNKLFFIADDGIHGMEPWIVSVTTAPGSALPAYLSGSSVTVHAGHPDFPEAVLPGRPEGPGSSLSIDLPRNQPALAPMVRALSRLSAKPVDALFSVPWTESW